MTVVVAIPNTNTSVVTGPDGSGQFERYHPFSPASGFAIGLTCPVQAADTPYLGPSSSAFIGSGVSDYTVPVNSINVDPVGWWHATSYAVFDPFVGPNTDGGTATFSFPNGILHFGALLGWSPWFGGGEDRNLTGMTPVCMDNAEIHPITPLQGYAGPSAVIFGGSECLTKTQVITLNSAPGTQSITGVGFQPDFLYFLGCYAFPPSQDYTRDGTNFMVGAAGYDGAGNLSQWVGCNRSRFFGSNKWSRWHNDACIGHIAETEFGGATTVNQKASLVSMDPDGYTINLIQAGLDSGGAASNVIVLAVKALAGNGIVVGHGLQGDTSLSTPAVPGFQPDALLFASAQNTSLVGADQAGCYFNLGTKDAIVERSFWAGSNTGNLGPLGYASTVSCMRFAQTGGVLKGEANATLTGTGASLNWTTDDGAGINFGWVAFQIPFVKRILSGCIPFGPQIYRLVMRT